MDNTNHSSGFTLIELLTVVAIIGILAGLVLVILDPSYYLGRGRDAQRKSDLEAVRAALAQYYADSGREYPVPTGSNTVDYYNSLEDYLGPYLETFPQDPTNSEPNQYKYDVQNSGDANAEQDCYELSVDLESESNTYKVCGGSLSCQAGSNFCP